MSLPEALRDTMTCRTEALRGTLPTENPGKIGPWPLHVQRVGHPGADLGCAVRIQTFQNQAGSGIPKHGMEVVHCRLV